MAIMPGSQLWLFDGDPVRIKRRRGDKEYYVRAWKQVIAAKPRLVTICDWNNWNEETAIEGCVGERGWTDLTGTPTYDWYLQITRAYAAVFRGSLPKGTYVKEDGDKRVLRWEGSCLRKFDAEFKPPGDPIIELPARWLRQHGYTSFSKEN
jgi:hypothetical protein